MTCSPLASVNCVKGISSRGPDAAAGGGAWSCRARRTAQDNMNNLEGSAGRNAITRFPIYQIRYAGVLEPPAAGPRAQPLLAGPRAGADEGTGHRSHGFQSDGRRL